jgi:hypothetical protein
MRGHEQTRGVSRADIAKLIVVGTASVAFLAVIGVAIYSAEQLAFDPLGHTGDTAPPANLEGVKHLGSDYYRSIGHTLERLVTLQDL